MPVRHYRDKNCVTRCYTTVPSPQHLRHPYTNTQTRRHQHKHTPSALLPHSKQVAGVLLCLVCQVLQYVFVSHRYLGVTTCLLFFGLYVLTGVPWLH